MNEENIEQIKNFSGFLSEVIGDKGLTVEKLAESSDIPIHYLNALLEGEFEKLPPDPYVRGYLLRVADVLGIDNKVLWQVYKKESLSGLTKTSGSQDRLPVNRFAPRYVSKISIIIALLLIIGVILIVQNLGNFLGTPQIEITSPVADNFIVNSSSIRIMGQVNHRDKLLINNEEILVGDDDFFAKTFPLDEGVNTFEFRVKRFLGKEIKVVKQVIYQPQ